jgi:hypothetical protein
LSFGSFLRNAVHSKSWHKDRAKKEIRALPQKNHHSAEACRKKPKPTKVLLKKFPRALGRKWGEGRKWGGAEPSQKDKVGQRATGRAPKSCQHADAPGITIVLAHFFISDDVKYTTEDP